MNNPELTKAINSSEAEMIEKVAELRKNFENYQEEFYKLEGIADGFQITAQRLKEENELFKQLFLRVQELTHKDDFEGVKRLISGLNIKL